MSQRLPAQVDALRFAEAGRHLAGNVPLAGLKRLAPLLASTAGEAWVELDFGLDAQGVAYVRSRIKADLDLLCQRCLERMTQGVDAETLFGIVGSAQDAERLPERYEPLIVSDRRLFVADLVEDELLLSLPIVPKHADEECPASQQLAQANEEADVTEEKVNPFAILSRLKDD
ncbi:MAG: hypothetical protein AMJ69_12350 [Gammaproteobacteria bacterium SG8_47]|nr:MAG: hypothetical protein AMJ69_12350 [Gammaproteobacteria bacterium SG8_47]